MSVIQQNQSISEMEVEQERTMREWVVQRLPDKMLAYFDGVTKVYDKNELILVNIRRLGYKDIIMVPEMDEFQDEVVYRPFFKNDTLGKHMGYNDPRNLFKDDKPLYGHKKYILKDLEREIKTGQNGASYKSIIPEHLNDKSDKNRNSCIYIDINGAETLISAAMKQSKFESKAKEFKVVLETINTISTAIITKLNRIIAEYRHQEQTRELQKFKDDKEFIEKEKERLRVERIQTALIQYPDCNLQKTHKVYIFSCPQYLEQLVPMVKIGITDNLQVRLKQHQTSCPEGRFYFEIDTYDSKGSEQALLNMYRNYGLLLRFNNSAAEEWIKISSLERTKERLTLVAEHRNGEYEDLSDECRLIRELFVGEPEPFLVNGQKFIPYKPDGTTIMVPPNKKFIEKICEKIGINDNKTIVNKTTLLNTIRDVKKHDDFKLIRSKLPIDIDTFLEQKIDGISIKKELKGRSIQITIEITPSE